MTNRKSSKPKTKPYTVLEDGGGGLYLFVFAGPSRKRVIFAHSGYEYVQGQLTNDIANLKAGDDTSDWENCEEDPQGLWKAYLESSDQEWKWIADEDGIVPADNMGGSGQEEFYPDLDD
jgi:hypothetical protein